jgi:integrase
MRQLRIGRLRGGFCVTWTRDDGRRARHQLDARTRTEAEAEAIAVFRRVTAAEQPRGATVALIWQAYREDLGDRPTARTMGWTGKAILPHFGALRPDQITKAHCTAYATARTAAGISAGSIHTELGHLQSALRFAAAHRMIEQAPRIWRPAKPQGDKRILSPAEARRLIDAAIEPHIRLTLVLLLCTGARVGALLDLTWQRVDLERGTINLRRDDGTTRKGRAIVPMNATARAALEVARHAALSDHVIEWAGRPVKSIRKGIQSAVARAELGHVRIHDLRHTAAVTMLQAGVPLEMVAQVLGHSNTAVTFSTYARYLPEHMAPAVNALDFGTVNRAR